MVENPSKWVQPFKEAGADIVTIHVEADKHAHRTLQLIRSLGMKAGIALNPATPPCMAEYLFDSCDLVLVMTVNPGFGGQKFIRTAAEKINERGLTDVEIEDDGGVNPETAKICREFGANVLVAGNAVYSASDPAAMIKTLRGQN